MFWFTRAPCFQVTKDLQSLVTNIKGDAFLFAAESGQQAEAGRSFYKEGNWEGFSEKSLHVFISPEHPITGQHLLGSAIEGQDLFVCCLTSQQHASVSQGCHTEIEVADQTFYLTQSQYTDTGPTSPSADPVTPGAWQGSHWSFFSHWYDLTPKKSHHKRDSNPGSSALEADALPLGQRGGRGIGESMLNKHHDRLSLQASRGQCLESTLTLSVLPFPTALTARFCTA